MAWQSDTINPASTSPAGDITKITNDLQQLRGVIGGTPDAAIPSKWVGKDSDTGAADIPSGTTAQRPAAPSFGDQRANSTTGKMEWWNGSIWTSMGGGAVGGSNDDIFYENGQTVTVNYTISNNKNAMSAGPITVANGVLVTVPNGSTWTVV